MADEKYPFAISKQRQFASTIFNATSIYDRNENSQLQQNLSESGINNENFCEQLLQEFQFPIFEVLLTLQVRQKHFSKLPVSSSFKDMCIRIINL